MMMQELPLDQCGLQTVGHSTAPQHHPQHHHLDIKEENLQEDIKAWTSGKVMSPHDTMGVETRPPPWGGEGGLSPSEVLDPRHPWAAAVAAAGGRIHHRGGELDYDEDGVPLQGGHENGHHHRPNGDYMDGHDDFGAPYSAGGPQSSPFPAGGDGGPTTPMGFSPDQMIQTTQTSTATKGGQGIDSAGGGGPPGSKKSTSRRNAWGNLSYADLITQAIISSPEKRLTLSQVYDWMVQNIPYFKDKGDSNSSAGWKNSIRHNLSLHNKFVRVQNEGTGKSSWWIINPDAKTGGKSSRRRASNTEPGKGYDNKRRGRSKKSLDILRGGADTTPSPGMDGFPPDGMHPGFPFHHDIRLRPPGVPDFGGRMSPGGVPGGMPEFYQDGGWQTAEYMSGYGGHIPPPEFRPDGFCGGSEQERAMVLERMGGIPTAAQMAAAAAAAAQQQRQQNGFYRGGASGGGFGGQDGYPHSPIIPHEFANTAGTLSPNPHNSFPSPDHHAGPHQQHGGSSQREAMMSPADHQNGGFFNVAAATGGMPAPDSPAPGSSSSSSGSILERALAKQEPPSPHMPGSTPVPQPTGGMSSTPPTSMAGSVPTSQSSDDWSAANAAAAAAAAAGQGGQHPVFSDVNVDEYIKQHDFASAAAANGMEGMVEYHGYAAAAAAAHHHQHHHHHVQAAVGQPGGHGVNPQHAAEQYHHQQYAHHTAVSVGPPWVR